jgi:sarcosine oxidase, subunit alpha
MTQKFRLDHSGIINRNKIISFKFNGKTYTGFEGDTLASALLANNVHFVARSFKTHRPRGIMTAGVEEPNAIVQLAKGTPYSQPNMRATEVLLTKGLSANSVNSWPNLNWDLGAVNQYFSKFLIAGFYYKTFMWPKSFWKTVYEPFIRKMGGLGVCEKSDDPRTYDRMDRHCDILIVGSGPAGLAAAKEAAKSGDSVVLVDENPEFGLSLLTTPKYSWGQKIIKELEENENVTLLKHTTLFGYYESNYLCGVQHKENGQRTWHFHAKRVILATGAFERPLTFKNNDLPGIMLCSAAHTYLSRFGVECGKNIVIFTNNDSAYEVAAALLKQNINVTAIVDTRETTRKNSLGIPIYTNAVISKASGKKRLQSVVISQKTTLKCDTLLMSGGWNPAVHLFSQAGGRLNYCEKRSCFVPLSCTQTVISAGSCNGIFDLDDCIKSGEKAAQSQVYESNSHPTIPPIWDIASGDSGDIGKAHLVDFAEEVSVADIQVAAREGMDSVELVKRYTTVGMGVDQGKLSNVNAIGVLSESLDKPLSKVGTTKFRSPYTPVAFGALAGSDLKDLSDPIRTTTIHDWHIQNGALLEDVGQWKRAWYFPKKGEFMQDSLNRECLAVRNSVGMLDASTLGKIDIQGKDAAQFLDLLYTNMFSTLKVGSCRYGLMCHEDGMVFDDGVTARLGENHYYMTTTTGGAAGVLDWMEYWLQVQYPHLDVYLSSITEQFAAVVVTGPKARRVLEALCPTHSFDSEDFPYMSMQESTVDDIPVKLLRISFTGEVSYEVHCPALSGPKIWKMIYDAGAKYGITPYGTETMHILRAEKGFVIVGQETDGSITPHDLNMSWAVSKKKDFLGKRSLQREDCIREDRKVLVGLETKDPSFVLPEGTQLINDSSITSYPVQMEGHVTSSYFSATFDRSIALAVIKSGLKRMGETLYAHVDDNLIEVKIVSSVFYDPKGERQHVN